MMWHDPALECVMKLAYGLGVRPTLPSSLYGVEARWLAVERFEAEVMRHVDYSALPGSMAQLAKMLAADPSTVGGVADVVDRTSILVRLWGGCIHAAKVIADRTQTGANSPEGRAAAFRELIDPLIVDDTVYRAGVQVAPEFRARRGQKYSVRGLPDGCAVLAYRVPGFEYEERPTTSIHRD